MTVKQIRDELKEVRYYYARKDVFDKALQEIDNTSIVQLVKKYNEAVCCAPPKLFDIYVSLYVNHLTQEALSKELDYSPDYVHKLNDKLIKYLQEKLVV